MSWIIDLVIVLLISLCTFIGYKRGLIKVAIKILAFFIAIIISLILYKPVANFIIEKTTVDETIQTTISNKILPEGATKDEEVKVDDSIKGLIKTNAVNTVNSISEALTVKIIQIGCLLIIYIVARIILTFLSLLANIIEKIPIIKQFNEAGGFIYGLLKGILMVWVILAVVYLASPLIQAEFIAILNKSFIGGIMYRNNIILNFIS